MHGGSVPEPDRYGDTPLLMAARNGCLEVVQWLARNGGSVTQSTFSSGAQRSYNGQTPLHAAACSGHLEVVQWLAGNGGSATQPSIGGMTPLWTAASEGHLEVVQ